MCFAIGLSIRTKGERAHVADGVGSRALRSEVSGQSAVTGWSTTPSSHPHPREAQSKPTAVSLSNYFFKRGRHVSCSSPHWYSRWLMPVQISKLGAFKMILWYKSGVAFELSVK